ncbi:unnamed protein product [Cylindrotheca closterium]|uniref:Uncharacterized protein n=1 Tax=Cylindrotheca closterium TaxID=2856 RepID=A0AAD2FDK0_9STRA|nr:unnamed protein product [Cylindrotheca closterium]
MSSQDSIHRQFPVKKNRMGPFLGKQQSSRSLLTYGEFDEDEETDLVVPCVTQDEEDEVAQPSTLPQSSEFSLQDDTATEIWTEDESLGENSRSEIEAATEQLESRRIGTEHDRENYGVEIYLNHYEIMLQRQEDENVATLTHLKPMLEVLESLVKGKASAQIANSNTTCYDRTTLLREFRPSELKKAYKQLKEESTRFDFIRTDRQFMLVLRLLSQTAMAHQSVSWAEIAHCYKICVSGMQTLEEIPAGRMRNQIKERTIASLQGPILPKVPTSILKQSSKPSALTSVSTSSSSSPTISPLADMESKSKINFQDGSKSDRIVTKMKEAHETDVKEINFLKLTIAFLLGLMVSVTIVSQSNGSSPETGSLNLLLEQLSEAKAVAAEASISAAFESTVPMAVRTPQPQDVHFQPKEADIQPIMEEENKGEKTQSIRNPDVLESDNLETALTTFNAPKSTSTILFPSVSTLPEVRTWGAIAVATVVAPAVLQAAVALASTSLLIPMAISMIAATSALEGVRAVVLGWLKNLRPMRKS